MNVFLDLFCDYGTNPVKSIKWSFFVMSFFASFYFFFPYEGGVFNRDSFFRKIRMYIHFFTTNKSLTELYNEKPIGNFDRPKNYDEYLDDIEKNRSKLPIFIRIFGKQLFRLAMFKIRLYKWYYQTLDSLTGKWENLKGKKKFLANLLYGGIISIILLSYILKRVFDCLTLSLNAFSTLGFGEVPVKGIAQYLTVIEGFVGWFLLSIFSVALISQIIQ